jgi:hypothetical protein
VNVLDAKTMSLQWNTSKMKGSHWKWSPTQSRKVATARILTAWKIIAFAIKMATSVQKYANAKTVTTWTMNKSKRGKQKWADCDWCLREGSEWR